MFSVVLDTPDRANVSDAWILAAFCMVSAIGVPLSTTPFQSWDIGLSKLLADSVAVVDRT